MKIIITGTGKVGLSNTMRLTQHHVDIALDIDLNKVNLLNSY